MSATGRIIEADVIALDDDNPKERKRIQAEANKIAEESGLDIDAVLRVLKSVRARKRKSKRSRGDFYETPAHAIDAIIPYLPLSGEPVVLDAGAGTGAIAARVSVVCPRAEIIGIEKNPELILKARERGLYNVEFIEANFLREIPKLVATPDVAIFNPPFTYALEFVIRARELVKRGGTVCALLRLNWLAAKSRREFLKKHTPDVYILTKRPAFTGGTKTDATEYAWMVWGPGATGRITILANEEKKPRGAKKTKAAKRTKRAPAPEQTTQENTVDPLPELPQRSDGPGLEESREGVFRDSDLPRLPAGVPVPERTLPLASVRADSNPA